MLVGILSVLYSPFWTPSSMAYMSFIQHEALKHYEDMKIMASIMSLMAQEKRLLKWALRVTWCKIPRGFSGRCMAGTDGNWISLLSLHFTTVKRWNHTIEKLPQVFCFRWWEISEFFCTRREWSWFKSKWDFHLLWLTMRNGGKLKPIIHIIAEMAPCVMRMALYKYTSWRRHTVPATDV